MLFMYLIINDLWGYLKNVCLIFYHSTKVRTSITLKRECLDRMSIFSYFCNDLIGEAHFSVPPDLFVLI